MRQQYLLLNSCEQIVTVVSQGGEKLAQIPQ